jgi:hypothetical protein
MCKQHMSEYHSDCPCCCQQGPQGIVGPQGPQGIQGVAGAQGAIGPQGIQGSIGMQGMPGPKGDAGKNCDCSQTTTSLPYANVYASIAQTIQAFGNFSDVVMFDSQNAVSSGDFNLVTMNSTGDIEFLKHGVYHIQWQLQARIATPVPVPVPSWSFGFWINGILVPGSIYSGFTQAPGDDACHSTGDIIIEVKANDKMRLRNTSISVVNLNPNVTGSVFPITIASINIECLKILP